MDLAWHLSMLSCAPTEEPLQPRTAKTAERGLRRTSARFRAELSFPLLRQFLFRSDAIERLQISGRGAVTNQVISRDLLAGLCFVQGLATLAIDLNRTHATNPDWPGHARFHLVWQAATYAWLALLELVLVLPDGPFQEQRFYLAAILAGVPMLAFFISLIGRGAYRGTLSDPNGIRPVTIAARGSIFRIDLNLVSEAGGLLALAAIVVLYRI